VTAVTVGCDLRELILVTESNGIHLVRKAAGYAYSSQPLLARAPRRWRHESGREVSVFVLLHSNTRRDLQCPRTQSLGLLGGESGTRM
jgi:hypothetical protein